MCLCWAKHKKHVLYIVEMQHFLSTERSSNARVICNTNGHIIFAAWFRLKKCGFEVWKYYGGGEMVNNTLLIQKDSLFFILFLSFCLFLVPFVYLNSARTTKPFNLVEGWSMCQGRTHYILEKIQITGRIHKVFPIRITYKQLLTYIDIYVTMEKLCM